LIIGKIYKQKRKIKTIHTRFMMNPILSMDLISIMPSSNGQFELHFEIWQGKTPQNPVDFIR